LAQRGIDPEILVYDDASEVPVSEALRDAATELVRIIRSDTNMGLVPLRNRGFRDATGDYVATIDDDLILFNPDVVSSAARTLAKDPSIAVVGIRYMEPNRPGEVVDDYAGSSENLYEDVDCSTFRGGANVMRRDLAIKHGLYPDWVYRQGEERFLAVRFLDAGCRIVLHGPPSAVHLHSPMRDLGAMDWHGVRNLLLFDWICAPHPYFLPCVTNHIIKLVLYRGCRRGIPARCTAVLRGLAAIVPKWSVRRPVSRVAFRRFLRLPRHGPMPLSGAWSPEPLIRLGVIKEAADVDACLEAAGVFGNA
jgi:GT2 family glycosyltransferase